MTSLSLHEVHKMTHTEVIVSPSTSVPSIPSPYEVSCLKKLNENADWM